MKRWYCAAALVFALGLSMVISATATPDAITLSGMTIQPHVIKGLGLITMILSVPPIAVTVSVSCQRQEQQ